MIFGPELLLISAVAVAGVLHTVVPDHWGLSSAWIGNKTDRMDG
jgi:hypothetical protein